MGIEFIRRDLPIRVAVLYQATPPPVIDGFRKDPKPGGYSDSGADIAFTLRRMGIEVVTPSEIPDPNAPMDWGFPDTPQGLEDATRRDATVLWANTVLFSGHPIERWLDRVWVVCQAPERQQAGDDKFATNARLEALGLPIATSVRVGLRDHEGLVARDSLTDERLERCGLVYPVVVKPVRGRDSQGSRSRKVGRN